MSADDFDPEIERLFGRTPPLPDADIFHAEMQARLARGGRVRTWVLSIAGALGGLVAVRELADIQLNLANTPRPEMGLSAATAQVQTDATQVLAQYGLGDLLTGGVAGMSVFWIGAGLIIALTAAAAMRLAQDV
ncbi:hypothetical protein [Brevundimonas balnearis]|uniref:Uncharacterized protein n=1 Tax=Brevundimonas balnearis TaxID=1572858 RepID=A0ABV6R511_9CAUL